MNSPLNYLGGKSRLAKKIVPMIPKDHICYCEAFSGAAWVMFAKEPSKSEVLNDLDGDLVTFWRVIQNHLEEFLRYFKFAVVSREIFELQKITDPRTLTDIQRAVRYYYIQKLCFAGRNKSPSFSATATRPAGLTVTSMEEVLLEVHWRIAKVTFENLNAFKCIELYDRPTTFFYLDPPYLSSSGKDYKFHFGEPDLVKLSALLETIKGRFILSLNDSKRIREIFAPFKIKTVQTKYSSSSGKLNPEGRGKIRTELLIHNLK